MNILIDQMIDSIGQTVSDEINSRLNINKQTANQILPTIAPIILNGLKKQSESGNFSQLENFLGSGDLMSELGKVLAPNSSIQGNPLLSGIMSPIVDRAAQFITEKFKLDHQLSVQAVNLAIVFIMNYLSRKQTSDGSGGLNGLISMLDRNKDGKAIDDIAEMVLNKFLK